MLEARSEMLEAGETQTNEPVSGSCTRRILTKKNAGNDDIVIRISRSTIAAKAAEFQPAGRNAITPPAV